ncbi:MAG: hypothetical protein PHG00_13610 [Methylococcales bacterium]|nr:hypothetical protein [Methylococcales bacterium]
MTETQWWGNDPYWTDALDNISQAREDGGRFVTIDLAKLEDVIYKSDGPAYRLLEAMKSVDEHEGYDGYRGAPRLVLALLWRLQEYTEE